MIQITTTIGFNLNFNCKLHTHIIYFNMQDCPVILFCYASYTILPPPLNMLWILPTTTTIHKEDHFLFFVFSNTAL